MAFQFKELKDRIRQDLWPSGEQSTLVTFHDNLFLEAMVDIQRKVECRQFNNTTIFPFCNTLFNCGRTIIDKPRGQINRLLVYDQINQTTGKEDATVPIDWCSQVEYRATDYAKLDHFISKTLSAAQAPFANFFGWFCSEFGINLSGQFAMPGCWSHKLRFPPPDDAGLKGAPPLPGGFHYGQVSTDDPRGRAWWGLWAIKQGQIFIAPWIQSTETILVEWDGIKRDFQDIDIVDDDPTFLKAVSDYVLWQHERIHGRDDQIKVDAEAAYLQGVADLNYDCRKENWMPDPDGRESVAAGATSEVQQFTNDAQQATASCPAGKVGNPVTVTIAANTVISLTSKADANARAQSQALQQAGLQLTCTDPVVTFSSAATTQTANCSNGGAGNPSSVSLPAGAFTSTISQADADQQAQAAALTQAQAQLACTWTNDQQTATGACAATPGSPHTETIVAGAFSSTVSKDDANALALAAATSALNNWLAANCAAVTVFKNTQQNVTRSSTCRVVVRVNQQQQVHIRTLTVTVIVAANTQTSTVSQIAANNAAIAYGQQLATTLLNTCCLSLQSGGSCAGVTVQ